MSTDTVIEKKKVTARKIKEPSKYKVIACNDDYTPVDFVIAMLITVFNHDQNKAVELTLSIHNKGSAVVGTYSYEVAEQKTIEGIDMARMSGYPLVLKVEQV